MSEVVVTVLYKHAFFDEVMALDEVIMLDEIEVLERWRDDPSRDHIFMTKVATLRARLGDCEGISKVDPAHVRAFPPAVPILLDACRDALPAASWHGWVHTSEANRQRFARELTFALLYEETSASHRP